MFRYAITIAILVAGIATAQPRAYKDINFGDSVQVVADKLVQHEDIRDHFTPLPERVEGYATAEDILRYGNLETTIGNYDYHTNFDFFDGRLYGITFQSESEDASYFDTHISGAEATLEQLITASQGAPDHRSQATLTDLNNGFATWTARWETNEEGAAYRVGLARFDLRYAALLRIEWTWLAGLHDEAIDAETPGVEESVDDF